MVRYLFYAVGIALAFACGDDRRLNGTEEFGVVIRISKFPDSNNPVQHSSVEAEQILNKVYHFPEEIHDLTNRPLSSVVVLTGIENEGEFRYFNFKIREEARWSNGEPITTLDIERSLKIFNLPQINNQQSRMLYSSIDGIDSDLGGPRDFRLIGKGSSESLRTRIAGFYILPPTTFDPNGYLDNYTLREIKAAFPQLPDDRLSDFIRYYESDSIKKLIGQGGQGPYKIAQWNPGESVILEKNETWWGLALGQTEEHFNNYPQKITYQVIPDGSVALIALKNGIVDVLSEVSPVEFKNLVEDPSYQGDFHFLTPLSYRFYYLAFNSRLEKYGLPLRKAISLLLPYEDIIKIGARGFGQRTVGPINPSDSLYYNWELALDQEDQMNSQSILSSNGYLKTDNQWYDSEGNLVELKLMYPSGSSIFETIALIIKDRLESFGLNVQLEALERSLQSKRARAHDFELTLSSFTGGPLAHNFSPLFSRKAAELGGLNYSNFGSQQSDDVIEAINNTDKKSDKIIALMALQKHLHEEKKMLFLYFEQNRIMVNKRFTNVYGFSRSPGYNVTQFKLSLN